MAVRVLWVAKGLGPGGAERLLVAAAVLAKLGVEVDPAVAADPIRGHGAPVGTVEPLG